MTLSDHDKWLALTVEEPLEPDLPICDTHHHLWHNRSGVRYMLEEFLADTASGHNITSTVYMDCGSMYRADGPDAMKPVGEVEFANGVAAMCASGGFGPTRVAAGIVGYANLSLGAAAGEVLEAEIAHAPERFRGIRFSTALDPDPIISNRLSGGSSRPIPPWEIFEDAKFREGFTALTRLNLSFDAWLYHTQIPLLTKLATDFPDHHEPRRRPDGVGVLRRQKGRDVRPMGSQRHRAGQTGKRGYETGGRYAVGWRRLGQAGASGVFPGVRRHPAPLPDALHRTVRPRPLHL